MVSERPRVAQSLPDGWRPVRRGWFEPGQGARPAKAVTASCSSRLGARARPTRRGLAWRRAGEGRRRPSRGGMAARCPLRCCPSTGRGRLWRWGERPGPPPRGSAECRPATPSVPTGGGRRDRRARGRHGRRVGRRMARRMASVHPSHADAWSARMVRASPRSLAPLSQSGWPGTGGRSTRGSVVGSRLSAPKGAHGSGLRGASAPDVCKEQPPDSTSLGAGHGPGDRGEPGARSPARAAPCPTEPRSRALALALRSTGEGRLAGLAPAIWRAVGRAGGERRPPARERRSREGLEEPCGPPPIASPERWVGCGPERRGHAAILEAGRGLAQCQPASSPGLRPTVGWPGGKE